MFDPADDQPDTKIVYVPCQRCEDYRKERQQTWVLLEELHEEVRRLKAAIEAACNHERN